MSHMTESGSEGDGVKGPNKGNQLLGFADKWEATVWIEGEEGKKTGWMLFSGFIDA